MGEMAAYLETILMMRRLNSRPSGACYLVGAFARGLVQRPPLSLRSPNKTGVEDLRARGGGTITT